MTIIIPASPALQGLAFHWIPEDLRGDIRGNQLKSYYVLEVLIVGWRVSTMYRRLEYAEPILAGMGTELDVVVLLSDGKVHDFRDNVTHSDRASWERAMVKSRSGG